MIEARIESHRRRGEQYARWDPAAFEALAAVARRLNRALVQEPSRDRTVEAFLRVAAECVAREHTRGLLGALLPGLAEALPAAGDDAVALLARVFNLAEGLRRDLRWVEGYVVSELPKLDELAHLEGFLVRTLAPVIGAPTEPAPLRHPMHVDVVDLRELTPELVPGEMTLLTPRLVRVADRDAPSSGCGVLVLGPRDVRAIGPIVGDDLPSLATGPSRAALRGDQVLRLDDEHDVFVPHLRALHRVVVSPAGFAAASAEDSQRLWIVQAAS